MNHGVFGYTRWNHHDFKFSITNWYRTRFSSTVETDWIAAYAPSVIYSIARIIELVTSEDDHIILQTPAYDAFFPLIRGFKSQAHIANPLTYTNGRYELDFLIWNKS